MKLARLTHLQGPIARGTLRTSVVLGLRLLVQAGTLLLVARMLGPEQFGAFAGVVALALILGTLATFGTHIVLLAEVSVDGARRSTVLPYALPLTLVCGSALLVIYLLVCKLAFGEAGVSIATLVAIGATECLLQPLLGFCVAEHHGLGSIARSQLLQISPLSLRLVAAGVVIFAKFAHPLTAYGYGYLAASAVALAFASRTLPAGWPALKTWRLPRAHELREAAGFAAINITATSPAELDKTLATKLLPLAASGLYAAGARVIGAATLPVGAMMLAALPRLFRDSQNQHVRVARLLRWLFAAALAYSVALAVVMWLIAPAIAWIFGPKYHGIEHTIHWLTLAVPGMALRMAAGSVLMALGRPWMRVGFEAAGLAILGVGAVVLTGHFGAAGMPLALACSEWAMALIGMLAVIRTRPTEAPGSLKDGTRHST